MSPKKSKPMCGRPHRCKLTSNIGVNREGQVSSPNGTGLGREKKKLFRGGVGEVAGRSAVKAGLMSARASKITICSWIGHVSPRGCTRGFCGR